MIGLSADAWHRDARRLPKEVPLRGEVLYGIANRRNNRTI